MCPFGRRFDEGRDGSIAVASNPPVKRLVLSGDDIDDAHHRCGIPRDCRRPPMLQAEINGGALGHRIDCEKPALAGGEFRQGELQSLPVVGAPRQLARCNADQRPVLVVSNEGPANVQHGRCSVELTSVDETDG